MLTFEQRHAPLRRGVTIEDVGGAALYLLSDLSTGVTGDIHYVDCGYHIISMPHLSALKAAEDVNSAATEPGGGASRSL